MPPPPSFLLLLSAISHKEHPSDFLPQMPLNNEHFSASKKKRPRALCTDFTIFLTALLFNLHKSSARAGLRPCALSRSGAAGRRSRLLPACARHRTRPPGHGGEKEMSRASRQTQQICIVMRR